MPEMRTRRQQPENIGDCVEDILPAAREQSGLCPLQRQSEQQSDATVSSHAR